MKNVLKKQHACQLAVTWFGVGYSPFISGTVGSLAALPLAYAIHVTLGPAGLFVASLALFGLGVWASNQYLLYNPSPCRGEVGPVRRSSEGAKVGRGESMAESSQVSPPPTLPPTGGGIKDPSEIVIDEVAGQWLALVVVAPTLQDYAIAFALFRLFDILKPWPVSWADQKIGGGLGVMLDDMLAGGYAILAYLLLTYVT